MDALIRVSAWGLPALLFMGCYTGLADTQSGGSAEGGDGPASQEFEPAPASLRVLLPRQYRNAVRDLLGSAAADVASPPAIGAINGLTAIGAAQLALGDAEIDAYERSAIDVAAVAMTGEHVDDYLECSPLSVDDESCLRQFVTAFGQAAFRRPLSTEEIDDYAYVAAQAAIDYDDFWAGVEFAIAAFLQSPSFLYQVEIGEAVADQPSIRRLNGYEIATRMSFFLLDTTPGPALLEAAAAGTLDSAEGVRQAAQELLVSADARQSLANLYSEIYRLEELDHLPKDVATFPAFDAALAGSMRAETLALLEDVVWQRNADFHELFTASHTFVDQRLAALYGIPGSFGPSLVRVDLPPEQKRAGILGQGAFLSLMAHNSTTSPTLRGKFVREKVLCKSIPPPPPDVNTDLPDATEYKTMRERLERHLTDPDCAGCHVLMDPIGLGLENFDGIGAFRTLENGVPIDARGEIHNVGAFEGAAELGLLLAGLDATAQCAVRGLFRQATGHVEVSGEKEELERIDAAFFDNEYRLKDAMVELVASPVFRFVGVPQ